MKIGTVLAYMFIVFQKQLILTYEKQKERNRST